MAEPKDVEPVRGPAGLLVIERDGTEPEFHEQVFPFKTQLAKGRPCCVTPRALNRNDRAGHTRA